MKKFKKIIFRLSSKKLLKTIVESTLEFLLLLLIVIPLNYIMAVLPKNDNYQITEFLKAHHYQIFSMYLIFLLIKVVQMIFEKRHAHRFPFASSLTLVRKHNKFQTTSLNASPSGACIYTNVTLYEGQYLKLLDHSFPCECEDAVVRWYDKENNKAGLMFIKKNNKLSNFKNFIYHSYIPHISDREFGIFLVMILCNVLTYFTDIKKQALRGIQESVFVFCSI